MLGGLAYSTPWATRTGLPVCHGMETALIGSSPYTDISKYEVRGRGQAGEGAPVWDSKAHGGTKCSSRPGSKSASLAFPHWRPQAALTATINCPESAWQQAFKATRICVKINSLPCQPHLACHPGPPCSSCL